MAVLAASMAGSCLTSTIYHFKSIPFRCSSKVSRVYKATTRGTTEISSRAPFFTSVNRAEISDMNTQSNWQRTTEPARSTGHIKSPQGRPNPRWNCKLQKTHQPSRLMKKTEVFQMAHFKVYIEFFSATWWRQHMSRVRYALFPFYSQQYVIHHRR